MDEFAVLEPVSIVPAIVATSVWVAVGAAMDIYLVTKNKSVITDVLRTPAGKVLLAVLGLHVVDVLGKADPFKAAGKAVTYRSRRAHYLGAVTNT